MSTWLVIVAACAIAAWWMLNLRRNRDGWLKQLNLLGKWELEQPQNNALASARAQRSLTLSGTLAAGTYVARTGDAIERGEWRLAGHTLTLAPTEGESQAGGPKRYELRLFEAGRIGLDGPGRKREIYVKREGNVIPLVRPKRRG